LGSIELNGNIAAFFGSGCRCRHCRFFFLAASVSAQAAHPYWNTRFYAPSRHRVNKARQILPRGCFPAGKSRKIAAATPVRKLNAVPEWHCQPGSAKAGHRPTTYCKGRQ
jgi:hypothetical protein